MVILGQGRVAQLLRQRLRFLETEHHFQVVTFKARDIFSDVAYVRGSTYLAIGWDFREQVIGAEFYPWNREAAVPLLEGRTVLEELIAVNGGSASEIVRTPKALTEDSVIAAADAIGRLLRTYAANLLEDQWGDTRRRVQEWVDSGAWIEWRDTRVDS